MHTKGAMQWLMPVTYREAQNNRTWRWGYTCAERLFPNIQARRLGLQFEYRDFFADKISERSKVNGQKLAWSTVKLPKEPVKVLTRGRSRDYRVYGSDTPLLSTQLGSHTKQQHGYAHINFAILPAIWTSNIIHLSPCLIARPL